MVYVDLCYDPPTTTTASTHTAEETDIIDVCDSVCVQN